MGACTGAASGSWPTRRQFREYLHREFPEQASEWNDPKGRRQFLKLMSASLALAGVGACTKQPPEKIIPYVRQPEDLVPGRPLFFATAIPFAGVAQPVLVESHRGVRPKSRATPNIPRASAQPTSSLRRRSSACTIRIAPRRSPIAAKSRLGGVSRSSSIGRIPPEGPAGGRTAFSERPDYVAFDCRSDGDDSGRVPESEVAPIRSHRSRRSADGRISRGSWRRGDSLDHGRSGAVFASDRAGRARLIAKAALAPIARCRAPRSRSWRSSALADRRSPSTRLKASSAMQPIWRSNGLPKPQPKAGR